MGFSGVISTTSPKSSAYDVSARGFFIAQSDAGVTLTDTQKNATNQLVIDLKAAGLWTKMKAVYPMVGGTATSHKFNLITPADTNAAFRLNFVGGWTHSSNGALPNGTNAYADTFLVPNAILLQDSTTLSFYNRTTTINNGCNIGSVKAGYLDMLYIFNSSINYSLTVNQNTSDSVTTTPLGFSLAKRTSSTNFVFQKNSTQTTITKASSGRSDTSIFIGALHEGTNTVYYQANQCAFASIGDGLTDLESQLFYQITEKYQVALGRNVNATQSFYYNSAYNNETNAFLFSTQITDATIQTATNTLVSDLKTANIWTKMKAVYPMVGGTATTHKFNLVNPQDTNAAFRLQFFGGGTHSANGYLPNGSNAYAQTYLTPSISLSINNSHISFYSRTNYNTLSVDIGSQQSGNTPSLVIGGESTYEFYRINDYTFSTVSTVNSLGFRLGSRSSSTVKKMVSNNSITDTNVTSTGIPNQSLLIGAYQNNGGINLYSARQCAFASIGDGLTDAEALSFYNAVQTFQTTLGRQV